MWPDEETLTLACDKLELSLGTETTASGGEEQTAISGLSSFDFSPCVRLKCALHFRNCIAAML